MDEQTAEGSVGTAEWNGLCMIRIQSCSACSHCILLNYKLIFNISI